MFPHPVRTCLIIISLTMVAGRVSFARKPEVWLEARSPNFIVLTNANEKQGRRIAYQFEMIRAVFRQFFSVQGSATDPPVIISAARDEDTLKTLLPEYWAKKGLMHPAGYFMSGPEKNYVALRVDVSLDKEANEPYEPVYHEYVHYLTRRMTGELPLWLVEGLAEFYGNTRIQSDRVVVGAPSSSNLTELRQKPPLPLHTLFAVNASSPYYHEENKASIFYAESWVLAHYLMTRDWKENTHCLRDFVDLLNRNVAPEEAARRSIGDLATLENELREYVGRFLFTAARMNTPPGIDPSAFQVQPVSEAESLAARADFMARDRHYQEAQEMLDEALKLDPKLAAAHENMGFLYAQQNKLEEATQWYAQAVALNSQSYLANYYYAVSLFKGKLDDSSAAKAESCLRTAIKLGPELAPAYTALGYLLATRHENLDEAYRLMLTAVELEPGNVHYRLNSVQVLELMGRAEAAVVVAQRAAAMAKTPEEQAEASAVLANAQQFQEYQKNVQAQQEAFKKAQAEEAALDARLKEQADRSSASSEASSASAEDSTSPQPLRRRNEALAGNPPGSSVVYRSVHAPRQELLPGRSVVDGTIKEAKCPGPTTLELTLDTPDGTRQLYSDKYLKIPYTALNYTPKGIMNPCTDLIGRHARITYHPAKKQITQGELVAVELMKN